MAFASYLVNVPDGSVWNLRVWSSKTAGSDSDGRGDDIQLRTLLINTGDQQRNTKRPTHHRILVMYTLSEPQGKITNGLSDALNLDLLVVGEGVILRGNSSVIYHGASVGGET